LYAQFTSIFVRISTYTRLLESYNISQNGLEKGRRTLVSSYVSIWEDWSALQQSNSKKEGGVMSAFSGSERKCGWPAQKGKSQISHRISTRCLATAATAVQLSHSSHSSATAATVQPQQPQFSHSSHSSATAATVQPQQPQLSHSNHCPCHCLCHCHCLWLLLPLPLLLSQQLF
jgi:hypothetical protein